MKLRNKKTGEIAEPFGITCVNGRTFVRFEDEKGTFKFEAHSLVELIKEWEDVPEEPKEYWYIDDAGVIQIDPILDTMINMRKSIGNYFETKEEAEKAVEKLKAWQRLKDKGFKFTSWVYDYDQPKVENRTYFEFVAICEDGVLSNNLDDIELVFSGEDD